MRIIYIASMFHTNQVPIIKGWKDSADEALFVCHTRGKTENHSYGKPFVLGYSTVFKIFNHVYKMYQRKFNPNTSFPEVFEGKFGFPSAAKFCKVIRSFQPDLLILRDRSCYTAMCYMLSRFLGIPSILYNQTPFHEETAYKKDIFHALAYKLSPEIRMTPVYGNGSNKIINGKSYYVPFVITPALMSVEKKRYINDKINILSVGKYEDRKNHLMLLKVISRLSKEYPISLTIAGEVSTKHHKEYRELVQKYIVDNKLEDIVTLYDNIPPEEMSKLYLEADLFILASTREFASFSQLEAMAHATAVIVSDKNGTSCYVENGSNGYLFKDNDEVDLFDSIKRAIQDRNSLKVMGENAYNVVIDKYSFEKYRTNILKLYELVRINRGIDI